MNIFNSVVCFVFGITYIAIAENNLYIGVAAIHFFLSSIFATLNRIDKD